MFERKISIRNAKFAKIGLQDMCNDIKTKLGSDITIVEIGSFAGDSSEIFAKNFKEVICVDPWKSGYDKNDLASDPNHYDMTVVESEFDKMAFDNKNITKYKMTGTGASRKFKKGTVDVVYIDAVHTYEALMKDIKVWLPKVKKGGIICGHDFGSKHFPGVKKAIDEAIGTPDQTYRDSSWLKNV